MKLLNFSSGGNESASFPLHVQHIHTREGNRWRRTGSCRVTCSVQCKEDLKVWHSLQTQTYFRVNLLSRRERKKTSPCQNAKNLLLSHQHYARSAFKVNIWRQTAAWTCGGRKKQAENQWRVKLVLVWQYVCADRGGGFSQSVSLVLTSTRMQTFVFLYLPFVLNCTEVKCGELGRGGMF